MKLRFRLSPNQLYTRQFLTSTHTLLPLRKDDLINMHVPFVVSMTPFPSNPSQQPPLTPYNFQDAIKCSKCGAPGFSSLIRCVKDNGWLCPLCSNKNIFPDVLPSQFESTQRSGLIFDSPFPESNQISDPPPQNIEHDPYFYFVLLERSEGMIKSGLFSTIISTIKQIASTIQDGYISVFFFDSCLIYPYVHHKSQTTPFSICKIADLDNFIFPPSKSCFFKAGKEIQALNNYLDLVASESPTIPIVPLISLFETIAPNCHREHIPVLIISSKSPVGSHDKISKFIQDNRFSSLCFTLFSIDTTLLDQQHNNEYKRSISELSELSAIINMHIHEFSPIEWAEIPKEIEKELKSSRYFDVLLMAIFSPCFELRDIHGRGLRRTSHTFKMSHLSLDDTIYFEFGYSTEKLSITTPTIDILVRYFDSDKLRFSRNVSLSFSIADNMYSVSQETDYNLFISYAASKASDDSILNENPFSNAKTLFENTGKELFNNTFSNLFFMGHNKNSSVTNAFKRASVFFENPLLCSKFISSCPLTISGYLAPFAYPLSLNMEIPQNNILPMRAVNDWNGWEALYIRIEPNKALIFLNYGQNLNIWMNAVQKSPLQFIIKMICHEKNVSFMDPQNTHPLAQRIRLLLTPQETEEKPQY